MASNSLIPRAEGDRHMNRKRFGILAGIAGAAVATWWLRRRQTMAATAGVYERGEVIFSNTPLP